MQSNTDVTDAMIEAGMEAFDENPGTYLQKLPFIYRAMAAARPPVQTDGLVEAFDEAAIARDKVGFLGTPADCILHLNEELEALQRSNAEKDEALLECAEDLEAWVKEHYCTEPDGSCHPAMQAKMDRDLAPARKARKALSHSSETSND